MKTTVLCYGMKNVVYWQSVDILETFCCGTSYKYVALIKGIYIGSNNYIECNPTLPSSGLGINS